MASVAVVMPLYNKHETVGVALASVRAQTLADIEIVVVDDGSTDGSGALVRVPDPRVTVVSQANAGVSAARNAGIAAMDADLVAFIDADDLWAPDHLERLAACFEDREIVAAFSNFRLESRGGGVAIRPRVPSRRVDDYFAFALAYGGYPASASSVMVRREALLACGGFPPGARNGEDIDTWCRLACLGPFAYQSVPTATYHDAAPATSAREPEFPLFARRLPGMIGSIPSRLRPSARRYANFLLLEYARQMIDRGRFEEARAILLRECHVWHDPVRYLRRLARTWPLGRAIYEMVRKPLKSLGS